MTSVVPRKSDDRRDDGASCAAEICASGPRRISSGGVYSRLSGHALSEGQASTALTNASDTTNSPRTSANSCVLFGRTFATHRCVHRASRPCLAETRCTPHCAARCWTSSESSDGTRRKPIVHGIQRTSAYTSPTSRTRARSTRGTGESTRIRCSVRFLPR